MNVSTITMPADQAREQLEQYQAALQTRDATDEDRGVMLGLKAIAKGRSLIDLHEVFRHCPADAKGRPALAIARAHWRRCRLRTDGEGEMRFIQQAPDVTFFRFEQQAWHKRIGIPSGILAQPLRKSADMMAVVPLIPPNLRPSRGLNRYCILWEASWESVPVDPMLIRHLHGSLYVVLSVWDLTELERTVLSGRLYE